VGRERAATAHQEDEVDPLIATAEALLGSGAVGLVSLTKSRGALASWFTRADQSSSRRAHVCHITRLIHTSDVFAKLGICSRVQLTGVVLAQHRRLFDADAGREAQARDFG